MPIVGHLKHGLPNNDHVNVNNGLKGAILNLIKSKSFKMHPLLISHIMFYSNQWSSNLVRFTK